jgi:hypothetical protein
VHNGPVKILNEIIGKFKKKPFAFIKHLLIVLTVIIVVDVLLIFVVVAEMK